MQTLVENKILHQKDSMSKKHGDIISFELERDELGKKLGKGFPAGSIVIIDGGNGSGKSVFCQRLAYGFLCNDSTVTFISTSMTTKGFIQQMYSLDYPVANFLLKRQLLFIPVMPLINPSKSQSDFIERLQGAQELFKNDVIIIDTISTLIKHSGDVEKAVGLISFFKKLSGIGKTFILTLDSQELEERVRSEFLGASDISFTLKVRPMGSEIKRTIVVNKFTGARAPVGSMIGFRVEPKVGMVVEIATVS